MANNIRGITVEIGGDTTKLSKALTGVNKQSKTLQTELKAVDKALKLDPKNTELLKQKQTLLAESVKTTSERLKTLNSVSDEMKTKASNWDTTKGKIEENKKAIADTETQLKALKKEQDNARESMKNGGEEEKKAYKEISDKVKECSSSLNALNKEQKELENSTVSPEQYRAYQREVIETQNKLKALKQEQKDFGSVASQSLKNVGDSLKDAGSKIEELGGKFKGVSTGAAVALGGAVASTMDLDKGYDTILKKTGATGKALDDLKGIADNVFTSMPVDMDEVGVAVGEVNTRFGLTGDKLESLSKEFLEFAEINETDVNTSIGTISKGMAIWNLSSDEASGLMGKLTSVAQSTGISVETLSSNLQTNGALFQEMGLSASQSIDLMGQFEKSGVDTSTALAGLKKATKNYTDQGLSMDEALQKTISSIKDNQDETAGLNEAYEVFGQKGGLTMYNAIKNGALSLDDLGTSLDDYSDKVNDTFEATQDPWNDMQTTFNELKKTLSELGSAFLTAVKPAIEKVSKVVSDLSKWFSSLDSGTQEMIATIIGLVAVISPALIVLGKIVSVVGSLFSIIGTVVGFISGTVIPIISTVVGFISGTVIPAISTVVTTLGWPVVAIAGIIAAIVLLWNNCEWFRDLVMVCIDAIVGFFRSAWDMIVSIFSTFVDFFGGLWQGIVDIYNAIPQFFSDIFNGAVANVQSAWSGITGFFSGVWSGITGVFGDVAGWFRKTFENAWTAVKNVFSTGGKIFDGIKEGISNVFKGIVNKLIDGINKVVSVPFNAINTMLNTIRTIDIPIVGQPFKNLWSKNPVSVPKLPKLATGGWVDSPTIAMIGEGKEPEIVAPESKMKRVMIDALTDFKLQGASDNARSGDINNTVVINNNSKYTSPAENARLLRKTLNSYKLKGA